MKKFFASALMTVVTLPVFSSVEKGMPTESILESAGAVMEKNIVHGHEALRVRDAEKIAGAPSRVAASVGKVLGDGEWRCQWLITTSPKMNMSITMVDEATGEVEIKVLFDKFTLKGIISEDGATLTIPAQELGKDETGDDTYFYFKRLNNAGEILSGASAQKETVGNIVGNLITFPARDIWAIANPDAENYGYWALSYNNSFDMDGNASGEEWKNIGLARFIDGWVLPGFETDQFDYPYLVPVQQNESNPNVFRLVDPYHGDSPAAQYNTSTKVGYIQFDVTDPDLVYVEPGVPSGFALSSAGVTTFYCNNFIGSQVAQIKAMGTEMTPQEVVAYYEEEGLKVPRATYKDGVITFGYSEGTNPEGEHYLVYDACFGVQNQPYGDNVWADDNDNPRNMGASITLPHAALEGIYEDADTTVMYFNMQGLPVLHPESGQILVRRQGSHTSKIVVK